MNVITLLLVLTISISSVSALATQQLSKTLKANRKTGIRPLSNLSVFKDRLILFSPSFPITWVVVNKENGWI